jgi:hypothetical protein
VLLAACGSPSSRAHGAPATTSATTATAGATTTTKPVVRRVVHHRKRHVIRVVKGPVTAIGDSVMIDAAPALEALLPQVTVDAEVSRSAIPGPGILSALAQSGHLGASILIDLGTNGGISTSVIGEMLDIAAGRRVVMVTSHCGYCTYTAAGNAIIRSACVAARNCFVADWDSLAGAHPEWFSGGDGVHMGVGGKGAYAYARLVRTKLGVVQSTA